MGTTVCAFQVYRNCVIKDCSVKVIFLKEALFRLSERGHLKFSLCFYLELNLLGHSRGDRLASQADASACLWGQQQCENPLKTSRSQRKLLHETV